MGAWVCRRCGCEGYVVVRVFRRFGVVVERRRCDACGREGVARGEDVARGDERLRLPAVVFHVMRCPGCGSRDVRVTSTQGVVRWHVCVGCGGTFKSVERG